MKDVEIRTNKESDSRNTGFNQLKDSKNPYLLQHSENPVHWYPWCDEAFNKARSEDKPIFLSIGYSTCHWCHVMAEESFDDLEVAKILNSDYISIKVDREERPDVDKMYQEVCLSATGQGGWPLTIIMNSDKKPFFAGTYFPKTQKYGKPGLIDILKKVKEMWKDNRQKLVHAGDALTQLLIENTEKRDEVNLDKDILTRAYGVLKMEFDNSYGGFGYAPKFPMPANIQFLLRYHRYTKDKLALDMVEKTLTMMRRGGIYDQIGFGFHRYSTDHRWLVPHFEKMLYDNALLIQVYLEAYQVTKNPFYSQVAHEIFTYLLQDMQAPEGGFASAEDADFEGGEGRFYMWQKDEIYNALDGNDAEIFTRYFDITRRGNFGSDLNIPNLLGSKAGMLQIAGGSPNSKDKGNNPKNNDGFGLRRVEDSIRQSLCNLLNARSKRVRPFRDEKVLTAWNSLAISAFAKGGRILGEQKYLDIAIDTLNFVLDCLRRTDGKLLASYYKGKASTLAYLDDYAFLIRGLLELWEASFEKDHIQLAIELMEQQIELFWDDENSGFYFTPYDSHNILVRYKDANDGALPSGNSVSAHNLIRLSRLTGKAEWETMARDLLKSFSGNIALYPSNFPMLLSVWILLQSPPVEITIAGELGDETTCKLWDTVKDLFLPGATVFYNPGGPEGQELSQIFPSIIGKEPVSDKALVYVCQGLTCLDPIDNSDALRELLSSI